MNDRSCPVEATGEALWSVIEGIGGQRGWYSWRLGSVTRGIMDRPSGDPGLRRGRRHPDRLRPGDALDWWRVETVDPGRLPRLRAEMTISPFHRVVFGGMQRNIARAAELQ